MENYNNFNNLFLSNLFCYSSSDTHDNTFLKKKIGEPEDKIGVAYMVLSILYTVKHFNVAFIWPFLF